MSSILSDENNIIIRKIKPEDSKHVLEFLRNYYYKEEPLTIGNEPKEQDPADEEFNMSNINHCTCVMAVHMVNGKENIIGAILAGPKEPNEYEHLYEEGLQLGPTKWGKTISFLATVERDANVFQRYNVNSALHAHVLGVDTSMRGKNIGFRLFKDLEILATGSNYELLTADCTSHYSARLCERLGYDCVNVAYYADYLDDQGKQVFQPPAPHVCVKTFAKKL